MSGTKAGQLMGNKKTNHSNMRDRKEIETWGKAALGSIWPAARGPPACPPGLVTNALRQPGSRSCHQKAPSLQAGSQRPAAAGAALRAGNLIISAVGAGTPGSRAARSSVLEALPAREAVQREASPAKRGFAGQQAWRRTCTSLQSTLCFQNCAWALPGLMGTDGAFIPAAPWASEQG